MAPLPIEDTTLSAQALAYVIELYQELTAENGAPTLGNQNQAVDFIRADPDLRRPVAAWAETVEIGEATTGKTHMALALGLAACQRGFSVSFATAAGLVITP